MKLTNRNSPKYTIEQIKRYNEIWKARVEKYGQEITIPELKRHLREREDLLQVTTNIAVAMTEKERIKILEGILKKRTNNDPCRLNGNPKGKCDRGCPVGKCLISEIRKDFGDK